MTLSDSEIFNNKDHTRTTQQEDYVGLVLTDLLGPTLTYSCVKRFFRARLTYSVTISGVSICLSVCFQQVCRVYEHNE